MVGLISCFITLLLATLHCATVVYLMFLLHITFCDIMLYDNLLLYGIVYGSRDMT